MRQLKVLLASTTILACGPALAADLSYPVKAPAAVVVPATNWNGFYIGGFGGWGSGTHDFAGFLGGAAGASADSDGAFGGGLIGFNWQGGNWVFGIEADAAAADFNTGAVNIAGDRSRVDFFGTVRGRVGYAFSNVLVYGTGGYAYANNRLSLAGIGAQDQTHSGFAAGGGIEWAFSPNWSAKVEYLYMDFDAKTYNIGGTVTAVGFDQHTIKGGINYRFNWGGPVVAAY